MTTFRKSVPRPAAGAGAPTGKNPNASVIHVADILAFPDTDENGVKLVGNIVLKLGAKVERIYLTDASQKVSHKYDGDPDAGGLTKTIEGTHPGDELAINEYIQNNLEEPVIIVYDLDCNTNKRKVVGLKCNPLYLKPEFIDDNSGVKHTLVFEQRRRDRHVSKFYEGELSFAENAVSPDTSLVLAEASGFVYQLPAVTVADTDVTITSTDITHKKVISLIGGGGSEPATLSGGVSGPVTVLLDNGTPWVAVKDSVIHLQVFDAGATVYLIEMSRS
jgi:hypothetical protein